MPINKTQRKLPPPPKISPPPHQSPPSGKIYNRLKFSSVNLLSVPSGINDVHLTFTRLQIRKLKYHQYVPPDQRGGKEPPATPQLDSSYAKLLQQQQLFLQLQILSQQKLQQKLQQQQNHNTNSVNYATILPARPKSVPSLLFTMELLTPFYPKGPRLSLMRLNLSLGLEMLPNECVVFSVQTKTSVSIKFQ